jgi:hypothetical protein
MDANSLQRQPTLTHPSPSTAPTRVPAEIWTKIIHWGIGGPGAFVNKAARQDFLHIRQVSTVWRAIAFSNPQFWQHLSIDTTQGEFGDSLDSDSKDPAQSMMLAKIRIPQWFGRAGRGAQVHLRLGGWPDHEFDYNRWLGVVWGREERPYRLVTCQLWEEEIMGPETRVYRRSMLLSKNASPAHDQPCGIHVPSLAVWGLERLFPQEHSADEATLRSLLMSHITFSPRELIIAVYLLPGLKELILHNSRFEEDDDGAPMVNLTIQTLVCTPMILFTWPKLLLPSIRVLKLICDTPNTYQHISAMGGEEEYPPGDLQVDFALAGDAVAQWEAKELIIDMTLLDLDSHDIIAFLSRCGPVRSLRLKDLSPLLSDDERGRAWRINLIAQEIICQQYPILPPAFTLLPPLGANHSSLERTPIFVPDVSGCQEARRVCCVEVAGSEVNLISLPPWRINELLEDGIDIQNHEFERAKGSFRG